MEIGYCLDCKELNYAMTNANGNFERANMSNNHEGHKQIIFGKPNEYPPPIRNVLTKLQAGLPISNNEIVLFKLSMSLDLDYQKKDARKTADKAQYEKFKMAVSGATAECPGTSGIAAEDCNCRCFVEHKLMNDAEFFKATGRHFSGYGLDISGESGIIRETSGKDKPITPIKDGNIDKVPLVKIPGYDDKQCEYIQEQHKELLRYARDNNGGNEAAFVFTENMTRLEPFMGTDDEVEFGMELLRNGKGLTVLHNHPRNGSFSTSDIYRFGTIDNISTLTIQKNNGEVEYITKLSDFDIKKFSLEYNRLYKKIVTSDDEKIRDKQKSKFVKTLLSKTKSGVIWSERK